MGQLKNKQIIIYGLGEDYRKRKQFYEKEFDIVGYCDTKNFDMDGYLTKEDLCHAEFDYIYITTRKYYREIKAQLVCLGIKEEKIISEAFLIYLALENYQDNIREKNQPYPYPYYHLPVGDCYVNVSIHRNNVYEPIYPNYASQTMMPACGKEIYNSDGRLIECSFCGIMKWQDRIIILESTSCGIIIIGIWIYIFIVIIM